MGRLAAVTAVSHRNRHQCDEQYLAAIMALLSYENSPVWIIPNPAGRAGDLSWCPKPAYQPREAHSTTGASFDSIIRRSDVTNRRCCTRALATMARSAGSRSISPSSATSAATSTSIGTTWNPVPASRALNNSRIGTRNPVRFLPNSTAISSSVMALKASGSPRRFASRSMRACSRDSLFGSSSQRTSTWVSSRR
jgi:hypothetical protein